MVVYTGKILTGDQALTDWYLTNDLSAIGETYMTEPLISGGGSGYRGSDLREVVYTAVTISGSNKRSCGYIKSDGYGGTCIQFTTKGSSITYQFTMSNVPGTTYSGTVAPQYSTFHNFTGVNISFTTNVPIFDGQNTASAYLNAATEYERLLILKQAYNYQGEIPELKEYYYFTRAKNYTVDQYGNISENTAQGEVYRGFKIKTLGKASVYKIDNIVSDTLRMGINLGEDVQICYYSTDGEKWTYTALDPTSLPYDWTYRPREDETGTFWCSVGEPITNMFTFLNKQDSDDYNNGLTDGRKASNYDLISSGSDNPTGDDSAVTEFGEVKTRGFFSQQYICNAAALTDIASSLYDTTPGGIWEDMKKGLDMYGDNPIEAVMGLSFWPVDLTTVITNVTSTTHIYFGGYMYSLQDGAASKINYPNGYKTLGVLNINRSFNNWRDYAPYTRLYVRLPYVGCYELDTAKYYGKSVEVRYYFDTRSGSCIACLIANGHLMDYWNGQMAVSMPLTLTDFSGYANAQIQTLLGFGGQTVSTGMNAASSAGQLAAAGTGAIALGAVGAGLGGAVMGAKTVYGLSQNNINKFNQTKGGSSSMINEYLPQYVEFMFEIQEDCAPSNYGEMFGYPSMKTGSVGSFTGFLKTASVKLNCPGATETEKQQILSLLNSGIYI